MSLELIYSKVSLMKYIIYPIMLVALYCMYYIIGRLYSILLVDYTVYY